MKLRRVAIVTGASSGIGLALAERAARAGWHVFAVGRRAQRLAELAERTAGATGSVTTLALDLREPHAAERIARATVERYGRIDVLVNNAGGVAIGPISRQTDDALREQFETHVIVPLALTRETLPALRASRGHVFFVGSGVARIPVGTLGAYPPAKAAVRNLARIVRGELRRDGIAVTYVDPGAVASEFMTRAGFAGPARGLAASPYGVARTIFAAFETRPAVVNAVPWQTFLVALGERVPAFTDALLARAPQIVGGKPASPATAPTRTPQAPSPAAQTSTSLAPAPSTAGAADERLTAPSLTAVSVAADAADPLTAALAGPSNRMRKLKLQESFLREVLVAGSEVDLGEVAMRWAGMPNKNERALTSEVFEALETAGYVERVAADRYRVVRSADA